MTVYTCARCKKPKLESQFNPSHIKSQPNSSWCNECNNKYKNNLRDQWKEEKRCVQCGGDNNRWPATLCQPCRELQATRSKNWLVGLKKATFEKYGGCFCACCHEDIFEFLTLDHIDGSGGKHRKELRGGDGYSGGGGGRLYSWLKKNSYPQGYRVLCWNCNAAIGMFGVCPHEKLKDGNNPNRCYPDRNLN